MTEVSRSSVPDLRGVSRAPIPIWHRVWSALKLAQVRLRIPIVLVVAALLVGRWEVIRNHWDRLTRGVLSESIASNAVSADTEYFCPMDPGVVSDWPGKCGICNMALVRRKRGEALALPDGVIARMQLSPYRIQLAGIQTAPATFRPLVREVDSSGVVACEGGAAMVRLEIATRQAPWIAPDQTADVSCRELSGRDPMTGVVRNVGKHTVDGWEFVSATIAINNPPRDLVSGMIAVVRIKFPAAVLEPFCEAGLRLPGPSRKPDNETRPLSNRPQAVRVEAAIGLSAAAVVVPDASECNGRPGWDKLQSMRWHESRTQSDFVPSSGAGSERAPVGGR
jgi:hypothetical protein